MYQHQGNVCVHTYARTRLPRLYFVPRCARAQGPFRLLYQHEAVIIFPHRVECLDQVREGTMQYDTLEKCLSQFKIALETGLNKRY